MYNSSSPPCIIPTRVSNLETANTSEILHVYIMDDKAEKIEEFIVKKGVPVDIKNKLNQTALFVAAFSGSEKTLIKLLQLGADPNKGCGQFFRYTPVHGACFSGSPRVLTYLVEAGGDLRRRDEFGRTPRDWAVGYLNRPAQRMEILAVIESYRELATSGSSKAVDAFKKPKSKMLRSMAQILHLPYAQQEENIPGPLGHIQATGFGTILFGSTATMGCIPVRKIQENECTDIISKNDLESNKDIYRVAAKKAVPYRCGTVTEYYPRSWKGIIVTIRRLIAADLKRGSPSSTFQNLLMDELENLRVLRAPGILHLLGVIPTQENHQISLVYERVQFGSLHRCMHELPIQEFGLKKKLTFLCQIATALKLVHNMGFLHLAISSHSVHIVSPTRAKLGNFEFAIRARGELNKCVYVQRPWDVFKNIYWRWMSPEVMERQVPTVESDNFSLCMVVVEVFTGELPWEERDFKHVLELISQKREESEKYNEKNPVINVGQFPTLIRRLLRAGLDVQPRMRCDSSEIEFMLEQQIIAISKTGKGIRPSLDQSHSVSKISFRQPTRNESDSDSEISGSSQERFVIARDSGVFGTPEVTDECAESVSSSSFKPYVQQKVETLVRRFSTKRDSVKPTSSRDNTVYQSVSSSPIQSRSFSRRFSLPSRSKKNETSSFDSAVKVSFFPQQPKHRSVNDSSGSSWGNILNSSKAGILKLTKRTLSTELKSADVSKNNTVYYSIQQSLDTVDRRPEPICAKVQKGEKCLSKNESSKVIPPPPPMPKITQELRKPASHFSSPTVYVPPVNQDGHRVPSKDENRYTHIPSDIKSVVAQPRHVIEKEKEFDRSERRCILSRANSSAVCTQTENFCSKGTQTDVFQGNSSDEVKRYLQTDSDDNSSGSYKLSQPLMVSTPQRVDAIHDFGRAPSKNRRDPLVGSYEFSRGNIVETSSPFTIEEKKRCVSFYEPGVVPQRPTWGKNSKESSSNGSLYETANEVSQPEKFFCVPPPDLQKPKAKLSPPPPKPARVNLTSWPLVPYDDSVPASEVISFISEKIVVKIDTNRGSVNVDSIVS
ncbi:hypothetical protein QYM36_013217 [Artemia franciscana]|uniref:Protein kinase domain-containing protein n=1 Tax=Artemia franciscana TaxID=6661 RepID=A0AA88L681_ARTSF|nr:hypothetical protein QYM36_013217 [Artemia franciscana]